MITDQDRIETEATIARYETTAENYELLQAKVDEQAREGWVLAPQEIHLSASDIELINGMCGDGNEESGYGPYQDGTLYIGYAQQDDGSQVFGLHISCDECPEEGVTTLAEFAAAPSAAPAPGECVAVPVETLSGVLQYCDQLLGELNGMYQYSGSTGDDKTHEDQDYSEVRALLARQGKAVGDE